MSGIAIQAGACSCLFTIGFVSKGSLTAFRNQQIIFLSNFRNTIINLNIADNRLIVKSNTKCMDKSAVC